MSIMVYSEERGNQACCIMRRRWNTCYTACLLGAILFVLLQFFDGKWKLFNVHLFEPSSEKVKVYVDSKIEGPDFHDIGVTSRGQNLQGKRRKYPDVNIPPDNRAKGKVDFRMIVIVFNRPHSLLRLLNSINSVKFYDDSIVLDVWIDRSKKDGSIDKTTYKAAVNFKFKHGQYYVHNHTRHVGIYGQWMSTWQPEPDSKEIAVILEDDLTVSPYLYRWIKNMHQKYDGIPEINGYSLQGISMKHSGAGGNLRSPDGNVCHMYPIAGSWGFSPKRENWRKFVEWYKKQSEDEDFMPLVAGNIATAWYKTWVKKGKMDTIWTMWYIYYTNMVKEWTVYPNLPKLQGLTINWKENGLHYQSSQTKKKVNSDPLLQEWDEKYDDLPDMPIRLDINGKVVH